MQQRRALFTTVAALLIAAGCSDNDGRLGPDQAAPGSGALDSQLDRASTRGDTLDDQRTARDGTATCLEAGCGDGGPPAIWRPTPGTSWQWQLSGALVADLPVQMYDIDLFDHDAATIGALQQAGYKVICYFSAGSYEAWRPDADQFPQVAKGKKMQGWDELWLDIRDSGVRAIMAARLDLAASKGCTGVEPDNVDAYANDSGFELTYQDQLDYNTFLASEAHAQGLSVGLKNDLDQVQDLLPHFDWALNEECLSYDECHLLTPFIAANKAVFHVEYAPEASAAEVCPQVQQLGFDSLIKNWDLDAWYEACSD